MAIERKLKNQNLLTTILTIRICQLEFKMRNQFKIHRIMAQGGLPKKHFFGTGDCMFLRKIPVFAVHIPILGASAMGCNQTSRYCPVGFQKWQRKTSPMSMMFPFRSQFIDDFPIFSHSKLQINRRCPSFFSSALGGAIFTRHLLTCGSSRERTQQCPQRFGDISIYIYTIWL